MKRYILPLNVLLFVFVINCSAQERIENLSDTEKLYGLSNFWKEASYNFIYFDKIPELNWDSAYQAFIPQVLATNNTYDYYRVLMKFAALLKDGHTYINFPSSYRKDSIDSPPVSIRGIDNKAYIINTGNSLANEIAIGSEIISVNEIPVNDYLQSEVIPYTMASGEHILYSNAYRNMLTGRKNTSVNLTIKTPEGTVKDVNLIRDKSNIEWIKPWPIDSIYEYKSLADGISYISLNTFADPKIIDKFKESLPELYNSKGIIIDIRKNGGGSSTIGAGIIKYFTEEDTLTGSAWHTREHKASYKAWGYYAHNGDNKERYQEYADYYPGKVIIQGGQMKISNNITDKKINVPVVVLIGNTTGSAAEDFLIFMDGLQRATYIGEPTNGSTGQPLFMQMPGGGIAGICTKKDTYPDGREFVGPGIQPHIFVPVTLQTYLGTDDPALSKGIEVLKSKMNGVK